MFGGRCFLLHGNIACDILQGSLIVRVGPDRYQAPLAIPGAKEFDVTGRPIKGWVVVAAEGLAEEAQLAWWLEQGGSFALTLPPK